MFDLIRASRRKAPPSRIRSPASRHSVSARSAAMSSGLTVEQRQLVGKPFVQPGESRGGLLAGEPQRPLELRGGLPVRPQGRGGPAGPRRGACTAGPLPRAPAASAWKARRASSSQHKDPQRSPALSAWIASPRCVGHRLRHRQPGDLVAEPHPLAIPGQQAAVQQFVQARGAQLVTDSSSRASTREPVSAATSRPRVSRRSAAPPGPAPRPALRPEPHPARRAAAAGLVTSTVVSVAAAGRRRRCHRLAGWSTARRKSSAPGPG